MRSRTHLRHWLITAGGVALATLLALGGAGPAAAKPTYPKELGDYYGAALVTRLKECGTCHAGHDATEPKFNTTLANPHNVFGARLMAVGKSLQEAGKRADLKSRLKCVAEEDADGDGVANESELLTGHRPGTKKDRPSPAELKRLPALRAALAKQRGYAWEPFEPVKRPTVPNLRSPWIRNPVDAFVLAEQRARGLKPRPEAPRNVLMRRLYVDLVGYPPTREELIEFLADRSPDAYERLVDRLLASPQYGERWARHWMDVWRYSDWDGFGAEIRRSRPHVWRWRDWIVASLNEDRGYDRMVQEMVAGDELAPDDPKVLAATGFLARNWYKFNKNESLNGLIDSTSKAFLGTTVGCARCHDHKFDPISQQDYYRFRAFFETHDSRLDPVPGQADVNKDGLARAYDANPKAETFLFVSGDEKRPDKSQALLPAVPPALGGPLVTITPVRLPAAAIAPEKQAWAIRDTVAASEALVTEARAARQKLPSKEGADTVLADLKVAAAEARHQALLATLAVERLEDAGDRESEAWSAAARAAASAQRQAALRAAEVAREEATRALKQAEAALEKAARDRDAKPGDAALAAAATRADTQLKAARTKSEEAAKQFLEAEKKAAAPAGTDYTKRPVNTYPDTSTGRRLALAHWLTHPQNPLAARVAVNHVWLRHFGTPLVPTVFDFGNNGQPPTHPALLDWLAAEFMDGNGVGESWSMKRLHRLLVTSATYRMDSTWDAASGKRDPDNRFLWRMNPRRMEAEVVRDSILRVAGNLDLAMGGPDLDQKLGLEVTRRSLYFRHSVEKQVEFLATFDQANVNDCYRRTASIMPQQALALANSRLSVAQSRLLARKLWEGLQDRPPDAAAGDFVTALFQQLLSRLPTADERAECARFLSEQAARLANPKALQPFETGLPSPVPPATDAAMRARESLVHVLLNHNDFVTVR